MATPSSDRIIGVNEFFAASEARVDRWRTLNRVAKALAAGGARPAGGHGPDPKALLAELAAAGGPLRLSRARSDGAGPRASEDRRLDRLRASRAEDQRRASRQQLPGRPGALEGRGRGRCPPARRPAAVDRPRPGPPAVLRDPVRLARRAGHVARNPGDLPPAAAGRGRVRLRAGRRRQLRGRGARRRLQREPSGGRDQRRLRVPVAVHDARAARDPAAARCRSPSPRGAGISAPSWRRWSAGGGRSSTSTSRPTATSPQLAGSDEAAPIRRIFYDVEEPMEIHLAILDGVKRPLRDALLRQPQEVRAAPDRHLPRAADRARQVDLQVELDPRHGRVLRRQPVPRRVVGDHRRPGQPARADRQHQEGAGQGGARLRRRPRASSCTNGTSTSNKIVAPGGAASRATSSSSTATATSRTTTGSCWRARSRYYVEAFPLTQYSMYGAVPLRTIKKALLELQGRGQARPREAGGADQLHLRRPRLRTSKRVMEECLAIKPDLIFLWDEAWFGFARFSPFLRRRTAMGAAAALIRDADARSRRTAKRYEAFKAEAGKLDPKDPKLLDMQLLPDPDKVRIRVYETDSMHKSMSALRQGSIIVVATRTSTRSRRPSRRRSSPTPRPRRTCRSSRRSTWRGGRWSWRATSWSCGRSSWRSRSAARSTATRSSRSTSASRRRRR